MNQFSGYGQRAVWLEEVKTQYNFGMQNLQAVGILDWTKLSTRLQALNFVSAPMPEVPKNEWKAELKAVLRNHIRAIVKEPAFIDYMVTCEMSAKEA